MLICREKVGGSQRNPLLTLNKGESMKLKKDYEETFKEGFRLGVRLTRAKACLENARSANLIGDEQIKKLQMEFASDWSELARNAGRKFTPTTAHEPEQPAFDFGDIEMQEHLSRLPHKLKETG
jgi:hypothetical protein